MDSSHHAEIEKKGLMSSPVNLPEISPAHNTDTDVEKQDLGREKSAEPPSDPEKAASVLTRIPTYKKIQYPIYIFFFVILSPLVYGCLTAATVGILPLLLSAFVLARVIQAVIRSENFEKHFLAKILMRYWMFAVVVMLLLEAGIFYPIAKYVPWLKDFTIIGLVITKWIEIICMLIGIYLLSQVAWLLTVYIIAPYIPNRGGTALLVLEAVSEIIGCGLFWWAESVVMNRVPTFNQSIIFGVYTRKWIRVTLFMLIGYNIITLLTHAFVLLLPKVYGDHLGIGKNIKSKICCDDLTEGVFNKRYVIYVACGLKRSIIFILSTLMLLLTWVLHIGDYLNKRDSTSQEKEYYKFGTWTFLSVLIWSFLWLIKSCVLLYWEANAVHDRLLPKISLIGKQLYFLVMLNKAHYDCVLAEGSKNDDDQPPCVMSCSNTASTRKVFWYLTTDIVSDKGDTEVHILDRRKVRTELINLTSQKASIYDIQQAANIFLLAQNTLSKGILLNDLDHLQSKDDLEANAHITKVLKKITEDVGDEHSEHDLKLLYGLLKETCNSTDEKSFDNVKIWMERANNRCTSLANTLSSEKEVANCLNQILSGLVIAVIFIVWLLTTDLASTKVLVVIGSPLVAASFIFGETCKSFFQGLIFIFVVNPYDVGDLCLIDGKLLEVKRIGVWTTTFSNVRAMGTNQEVIQPNSVLATKNIINHKSGFDWNDYIEFCLPSPNGETTTKVTVEIETYLDSKMDSEGKKKKYVENFHSVEFKEVGDKAKIAIHLKYNIKADGWTYFECLKEKEKQRHDFAVYLQDIVNKYDPKPQALAISMLQTGQQVTSDST